MPNRFTRIGWTCRARGGILAAGGCFPAAAIIRHEWRTCVQRLFDLLRSEREKVTYLFFGVLTTLVIIAG